MSSFAENSDFNMETIFAGLIAVGLFAYLFAAMIYPEKF